MVQQSASRLDGSPDLSTQSVVVRVQILSRCWAVRSTRGVSTGPICKVRRDVRAESSDHWLWFKNDTRVIGIRQQGVRTNSDITTNCL